MVFLGGCATGLLITDAAAPKVRITQDIDAITEITTLSEYYQLADKLREKGFKEDMSPEAPICRWSGSGILLDVMPTNPELFGFGNRWYQPAFQAAESVELPSGKIIQMVSAPYFLAGKLAAFDSRGQDDYLMSRDMEDIVAVLDGRPEIIGEIELGAEELRRHLAECFHSLLN